MFSGQTLKWIYLIVKLFIMSHSNMPGMGHSRRELLFSPSKGWVVPICFINHHILQTFKFWKKSTFNFFVDTSKLPHQLYCIILSKLCCQLPMYHLTLYLTESVYDGLEQMDGTPCVFGGDWGQRDVQTTSWKAIEGQRALEPHRNWQYINFTTTILLLSSSCVYYRRCKLEAKRWKWW